MITGWRYTVSAVVLFWTMASVVFGWEHASKEQLGGALEAHEYVLVSFVKPEEPKSASLEQEWLSAVSEDTDTLLSVDCTAETTLCNEYNAEAFPSIQLFHKGKSAALYRGPRRAGAFLHWVGRWKRPVVSSVTADTFDAFRVTDEVVFVAFIANEHKQAADDLAAVAERYREEFSFGIVSDPAVIEAQNRASPMVVCYRHVDNEVMDLNSFDDEAALDKFVVLASRPVIGELSLMNQQRMLDRAWPMVYLFAPTEAERIQLRKVLYKFAKGYYESLTSVTVDPFEFPDLMDKMGLEAGSFPAGVVHQLSKDRIYPYPKGHPYTSNALQKWGLDVYQGRIKPWTPPGVTTSYTDLGPTRVATSKISIRSHPALKIRVGGHNEL